MLFRSVATQNPELRKRFRGKPEYVENFMKFIAEELREYMARLGVRTVDEMVGRSDLLRAAENVDEPHIGKVDLGAILDNPYAGKAQKVTFDPRAVYNFELEKTLDEKILLMLRVYLRCSSFVDILVGLRIYIQRKNRLETEVSESTVGLGHLVHVFLTLECAALIVVGVDDFSSELVSHCFAAALACVSDKIFH